MFKKFMNGLKWIIVIILTVSTIAVKIYNVDSYLSKVIIVGIGFFGLMVICICMIIDLINIIKEIRSRRY